ncbi:MAG: hypothetical protein AB7P24_19370 [Nitrospira sp.]
MVKFEPGKIGNSLSLKWTVNAILRPSASGQVRTFGAEIAPPQSGPQAAALTTEVTGRRPDKNADVERLLFNSLIDLFGSKGKI